MQKVQLARIKGVYSKEHQETERKQKKPTKTRPAPTDLMDPDQRLRVRREWVGFGSTRPRHVYKGVLTRFQSFSKTFSLSSLLLSAVLSFLHKP